MDLFYQGTEIVATHRYIEAIKGLVSAEREMLTLSGIAGVGSAGVLIKDLANPSALIVTYEGCGPGEKIDATTIKPAIDFDVPSFGLDSEKDSVGKEKSSQSKDDFVDELTGEFPLFMDALASGLGGWDTESLVKFSKALGGVFVDENLNVFMPTGLGKSNDS